MRILLPGSSYDIAWTRVRAASNVQLIGSDGSIVSAAAPVAAPVESVTPADSAPSLTLQVRLSQNVSPATAVIAQNSARQQLVIQNLSTATATGDIPPTLFVGFGVAAILNGSLALLPGVGLWLDHHPPGDAIYVAWGPATNTSGSVVWGGFIGAA